MPKKRKDLPEPPPGPFSRRRRQGEGNDAPQTADRLTMAMAEGRLDEFLEEEFGDIPNAKKLAMMMLGATGMAPPGEKAKGGKKKTAPAKPDVRAGRRDPDKRSEVPEELLKAAERRDVKGLSGLLPEEHGKRGGRGKALRGEATKEALFDKGDIDTLMKVAAENNVSLDWVISRAIKLYARDYRNTGRI